MKMKILVTHYDQEFIILETSKIKNSCYMILQALKSLHIHYSELWYVIIFGKSLP